MSDSESDLEMRSAVLEQKKKGKQPSSPTAGLLKDPRKMTTKEMILKSLTELNTRKGVSLYAIKKHMAENNDVNMDKISFLIKKTIKSEVEKGTIIQTKGIGASGSFRLAPIKKKIERKTIKKPEKKEPKVKLVDKELKKFVKEPKILGKESKKITKKTEEMKKTAAKKKTVTKSDDKPSKQPKKKTKEPPKQENVADETKDKKKSKKKKMAKPVKTPAKKLAAMRKRKSIGSIVKPPKMKPRAIKK